jgi:hypothetical protein
VEIIWAEISVISAPCVHSEQKFNHGDTENMERRIDLELREPRVSVVLKRTRLTASLSKRWFAQYNSALCETRFLFSC